MSRSSLFRGSNAVGIGATAPTSLPHPHDIGAQECGLAYRTHVERRTRSSSDLSVSKGEALASLGAARSFIAFLQDRWATRALGRPPSSSPPQAL